VITAMTTTHASAATANPVVVDELLVPVDLSHESWTVLPLARALGRRLNVPVAPMFVDVSSLGSHAVLEHSLTLRAMVDDAPVSIEVVPGPDVVPVVEGLVHDHPGKTVVMSTHGLGGISARSWGTVCDELLRTISSGVLAVGPRFEPDRHSDIRRVVACVDAAAPDLGLMQAALTWAEALRVPMVIVTVTGRGASRPGEDETYHVLAAIFEDLPPAKVAVTVEVVDDADVAGAIVRFADRRSGTLLALTSGAAERSVHALTHRAALEIARDTATALLLRRAQS